MFRRLAVHSREAELLCADPEFMIRSDREGPAHVVRLIGDLDMHSAAAFEEELKRVESTDARRIIVDLSGLDFIASEGLKVLVLAEARSRRNGRRLELLRGPDRVHDTFETSGLVWTLPFVSPIGT